jgi:hypothetical protein
MNMSWLLIILMILAVAFMSGLLFGVLAEVVNISPVYRTSAVGGITGATAAILISRKMKSRGR